LELNTTKSDLAGLKPGKSFCIVTHNISYAEKLMTDVISLNNPYDVLSIRPDNNIGIEEIRKIIDFLAFSPQGDSKIIVVYEADKMTQEAANAFLKTLEEPPSYSMIILITTRWNSLLPTVKSRVQRIFVKFVPESDRLNDFERYLVLWNSEFEERLLSGDYEILPEEEVFESEDILNQIMSIKELIENYLQKDIKEYVKFISRTSKLNDFDFLRKFAKVIAWLFFNRDEIRIEEKIEYLKVCDEIQKSKLANFNYGLTYHTLLLGIRGENL